MGTVGTITVLINNSFTIPKAQSIDVSPKFERRSWMRSMNLQGLQ